MEIVWENHDVVVVNKPSGVLCFRDEQPKEWPVMAHRLDRETSGALVMAKNPEALKFLMNQFKNRKINKEYLTLVHGWIEPKEGRIKLPLGNRGTGDVRRSVRYDGKMADTVWKTLERIEKYEERLSLLKIKIYTGRTHQIRVHLAHLGHPVFSDGQYLNKAQMKKDRLVLGRHFLHAYKIGFRLADGKEQEVVVDLPKELREVLKK